MINIIIDRYFRFVNEINKKEVNYEDYDWLEEEF